MTPAALAALAIVVGLIAGYLLIRNAWLRLWVAALVTCVTLILLAINGQVSDWFGAGASGRYDLAVAVLTVLVPPGLAAGLFAGGTLALILRRRR